MKRCYRSPTSIAVLLSMQLQRVKLESIQFGNHTKKHDDQMGNFGYRKYRQQLCERLSVC